MSKSIFISHAEKDKALAELLVNLIEDGIGVPEQEIFCSSLNGYGIPTGKNFIDYIKSQIDVPKVVIFLLTNNYYNSYFCLCEMGAAWVKSHQLFPILVPPLDYKDLEAVLTGTQAAKIDDKNKYIELRDLLKQKINFIAKTDAKWERKREEFLNKLPDVLINFQNNEDVKKNSDYYIGETLKFIAEYVEKNPENSLNACKEAYTQEYKINKERTRYYFDELKKEEYIKFFRPTNMYILDKPSLSHLRVQLEHKGREYLINNKLI